MTAIEWTDVTWNPVRGCSVVSPGCIHCYAMKQAHRFSGAGQTYAGLTKLTNGGPVWTGDVRLVPEKLDEPLRWRKSRRIFVNSMSDLFHEGVPDEFIDRVFAVMAVAQRHTFQVLTKRPERMREYVRGMVDPDRWDAARRPLYETAKRDGRSHLAEFIGVTVAHPRWPLPNVWLGVSVEDQARADERIPLLLKTPAAVRFLSVEPLLGPVDLKPFLWQPSVKTCRHETRRDLGLPAIDWVIVGGESGPGARPCESSWVHSIVAQCRAAEVAVFVKQLGTYAVIDPRYDRSISGATRRLADPKGGDPEEWPLDLRVREFPKTEARA